MGKLLQYAIQSKKKEIINNLIQHGVYKTNNKHLYELTLGELEKEYKLHLATNVLGSSTEGRSQSSQT